MISTIRSQFKQTTYRYVVFFLVSVIALSMVSSLFIKTERRLGGSWAVRVNGAEISYKDFAQEVARQSQYLSYIKAQYGQYADLLFQSMGWSLDPKVLALDILVREELLSQYADKLGIVLHPEYIAAALNDAQFVKNNLGRIVPAFVFDQSGNLDMNLVKTFLQQKGMTVQQFEKNIERALIHHLVLEFMTVASYAPVFDLKQEFIAKNLNKRYSYLTFSFDKYLAEEKKNNVSDEELQVFYDTQNMQLRRYWVPEKRSGITWKFTPKNYNLSISDEEIQEYYEDNKIKQYILDPLKVEVQQLFLEPVAKAEDIAVEDVEKALLVDKTTSFEKYWKALKPFARSEHKGEMEKNAFLLQNEGDMSDVFEVKEGKTIVRLVRRIPRSYKPLVNVKDEIKEILANKAFKKEFVKDIKHLIAQEDPKAMESFIALKAGKQETVNNVMKDETALSQQLFSLQKNSFGFFVENGVGIAVLLTDITEKHLPDFKSVKDIVRNDFYEHKAKITLKNKLHEAKKEASSKTFNDLREAFGVQLQTTDMIGTKSQKILQELNKKGLPVHEMLSLEKKGSVIMHEGDRNSYLITLEDVEQFDEEQFQKLQEDIQSQIGSTRAQLLINSAVASLHRNATIETSNSIFITNEEYSE